MPPEISVIIPIYNVEKYLDKCLYSVRNQSLKNIEIICVDDCSIDKSVAIVKKHAIKDHRITLVCHNKNLGLGGARNTAIRLAKSDYIASVDSDDYIAFNMLEILLNASDNSRFDVVCCGFSKVDEEGNEITTHQFSQRIINNKNNDVNIFSCVNPAFWNKLWRRSLFIDSNIFFPNHLYFEDMSTTPRIIAKSRSIMIISDVLYNYRIRSGSITSSFSSKHILDYFKGFEILKEFLEENNFCHRYQEDFVLYINENMKFHSQKLIESNMTINCKKQYLRHLLMLKISFIEYFDLFKSQKMETLQSMLVSVKKMTEP